MYGTNPTEVVFNLSAYAGYSEVKLRWSVGFGTLECGSNFNGGYGFDNLIIYDIGNIAKHDVGINNIESKICQFHQSLTKESLIKLQQENRILWEKYFAFSGFYQSLAFFLKLSFSFSYHVQDQFFRPVLIQ